VEKGKGEDKQMRIFLSITRAFREAQVNIGSCGQAN
jgi:hypothetical protein